MSTELLEQFSVFKKNIENEVKCAVRGVDEVKALINRADGGSGGGVETKSLAEIIAADDGFKSWAKAARGKYGMMVETKAITSANLGLVDGVVPQRIVGPGVRRIRVADLLGATPTELAAIPFVRESAFTNAAYPQTEASTKGESELTTLAAVAVSQTVAHWTRVPKQALDDLNILRSYVDKRLLNGLADKYDFELLRGDGTGDHLLGLMVGGTAFDTSKNVPATDNAADTLSEALEQIEAANHTGTGIVLNPINWRQMTRLKDSNKRYLLGGPAVMDKPQLWGLPVAVTTAMPPDKFLVGDFTGAAELFERQNATIDVSDSHSDFFIRNMIAVRAELRAALAIYAADGFVYGYLDGVAHV